MNSIAEITWQILVWGTIIGLCGGGVVISFFKTDLSFLGARLIFSGAAFALFALYSVPAASKAGGGWGDAFVAAISTLIAAVILGICWAGQISGFFGGLLGNIFSPQDQIEPQPLYSIAVSKRKRGMYAEAISHIRGQLEKFPKDTQGRIMLAEIYSENLNDLPEAYTALEECLEIPKLSPKNTAYVLSRMADIQIKFERDPDAARVSLERIIEIFPDSEQAQMAHQRISHLADKSFLEERHNHARIAVPHVEGSLGLERESTTAKATAEDFKLRTAKLVEHLESYPQDFEAREQLASLYAFEWNRLELALDEITILLDNNTAPAKQIVHWLNLQADILIKAGNDPDSARESLNLIVEKYPSSAAAQNAQKRIAYLGKEMTHNKASKTIKLGTYEKDVGLKGDYKAPQSFGSGD